MLMRRLADARTMMTACCDLMRRGPKAPGTDGMTLEMLDRTERWSLSRRVADEVRRGSYEPGGERIVKIPKPNKPGYREITIQNMRDRMVGRATVRILQPIVDPKFSPFSFGCRPRRGRADALATALAIAETESKWVWFADDVAKAFDRIPFARFLTACRAHFPDDVVGFLDTIARKGTSRGIRQGNPFSPLAANIFFDFFLDRLWHRRHPTLPLLRYVDDLLVVCRNIDEARNIYPELARQATTIGTPLKGSPETSVYDLANGATIDWLGYRIALLNGTPVIQIAERAWDRLRMKLAAAYLRPVPPLRAEQIIRGWLDSIGPCFEFENRQKVIACVRSVAKELAFEEIPEDEVLLNIWRSAYRRWKTIREYARGVLPHRLLLIRGTDSQNDQGGALAISTTKAVADTMSKGPGEGQ
jgi:hypothetical protein